MESNKKETQRILDTYQKRIDGNLFDKYSLFYPGELYMLQHREEDILSMLRSAGCTDLRESRILEVGCGRGIRLADWLRWGAQQANLTGLDLMPAFIDEAKAYLPAAELIVGGGDTLPYPDNSFDIVVQQTVFTSINDNGLRQAIANEMMRTLKPGGLILWYDFRYPNPKNKDVWPVEKKAIKQLFDGCDCRVKSVTLAPPLARRVAKLSFTLCRLLERIPLLRTHYLALIRKP